MKYEDRIEYFLKDHFKIKLHITILTIFLFTITMLNILLQIFDDNTNTLEIYNKIKGENFITIFIEISSFFIKPLSDTYYFKYYTNSNILMCSYWVALYFTFIFCALSFYFYSNIKNYKIPNRFYDSQVDLAKFCAVIFLYSFIIIGASSYLDSSYYMYTIFMFIITYLEINIIMLLLYRYLKSFIFMAIGGFIYFLIFKESVLFNDYEYNFKIIGYYKIIITFFIITLLLFLRYDIAKKFKYVSKGNIKKTIKIYFLKIYFLVKMDNPEKIKKRWIKVLYKSYNNIVILLSTYIVIISVWGFFNKVGGFLISSLFYILLSV